MTKRFIPKGYTINDSIKEEIYEFHSHQESIDVAEILNEVADEVEYYKSQFKKCETKLLREQRKNLKLKRINDNIRECLDGV